MDNVKTDVRNVFITAEVAKILDMTPSYILRVAQSLDLNETEMREAGKRNMLFSKEAVDKIKQKLDKGSK